MTGPAPDGHTEHALVAAAQARRDAETAEYATILNAATNGLSAYRIAQLTGRSDTGIRHIIRRLRGDDPAGGGRVRLHPSKRV